MGNGAGSNKNINDTKSMLASKVFLDEGVGIEASNISRKWTHKLSVFRNLETVRLSDSSPQDKLDAPIEEESNEESEESILYSSPESMSSQEQQQQQQQHRTIRFQFEKLEKEEKPQMSDDSEIDQPQGDEVEEAHKRVIMKRTVQMGSDNEEEEERNDLYNLIKDKIRHYSPSSSEESLESKHDLNFVDYLEVEQLEKTRKNSHKKGQVEKDPPLKRFYVRSRISKDKPIPGQEKKIKFDAKEEELQEFFEQEDDDDEDASHSSLRSKKHPQQQQHIPLPPSKRTEYTPHDFLADIGISISCKKGNKRDGAHLNDYFVYYDRSVKIIGLLNAHGEYGHIVSNVTYRLIFKNLVRTPLFYTNPQKALSKVLTQIQGHVKTYFESHKENDQNCILSGCVVTVVIQREGKLFIGHIGDNRTTVYKELQQATKQKKIVVELTPLHCPLDQAEKNRVFSAGGEIRKSGLEEYVYVRGRLYPQLHVTRSVGDLIGHIIGVSSVPFIKEYDITPNDTFLVLSTAHAFTYMEQEEIMNHLTGFSQRTIRQACDSLQKRAKSSWLVSEGVFEDFTIILVWLGSNKEVK